MTNDRFRLRRLLVSLPLVGLPLVALSCSAQGRKGAHLDRAIEGEARKLLTQGVSDAFVIGVVKAGQTYVRGFSNRPANATAPLDGDSGFQIGSLTKLFTVATLMSLVQDGHVSLDDTLALRLGALRLGGRVALSPRAAKITLRQLASHTSGLPLVPKPLMALPRDDTDPYSQLTPESVYGYLQTAKDLRPPGRVDYSNYGMGLLGHVLETATGATLADLMAERIFKPLSMGSTVMTPLSGPLPPLVPGVTQTGAPAKPWRFGALGGAGGLCSCVNDLLIFIKAHLAPDGPLAPVLSAMRQAGGPKDARLGWFAPAFIDTMAGNRTLIWHNGRVGGYASYLSIDVTQGTGVVILSAKSAEITVAGAMLNRAIRETGLNK